jgi:hypothetical protein
MKTYTAILLGGSDDGCLCGAGKYSTSMSERGIENPARVAASTKAERISSYRGGIVVEIFPFINPSAELLRNLF